MQTPENLRYTASHEWVSEPVDGVVTIGITDSAQDQLGDVVYVELPDVGAELASGDPVAVVESVKTASDIYAPVSGVVQAVNEALHDAPEAINDGPYEGGWLFRLRLHDAAEPGSLLDAAGYQRAVEKEG
jgi:glycine cleavage system H protein